MGVWCLAEDKGHGGVLQKIRVMGVWCLAEDKDHGGVVSCRR